MAAEVSALGAYPDSHPSPRENDAGSRWRRRFLAIVPVLVLVAWLFYLWSVSGVLTSVEKYPKGAIKAEGYLKRIAGGEYKRHGQWVTYHENGKIASQGRYELGKKTGEWNHWDQEGKPTTAPPE